MRGPRNEKEQMKQGHFLSLTLGLCGPLVSVSFFFLCRSIFALLFKNFMIAHKLICPQFWKWSGSLWTPSQVPRRIRGSVFTRWLFLGPSHMAELEWPSCMNRVVLGEKVCYELDIYSRRWQIESPDCILLQPSIELILEIYQSGLILMFIEKWGC